MDREHPNPPFFYKLFDDPTSDVYKELNIPPPIPDKRIVFDEEETNEVPADEIDEQKESISYIPVQYIHPCAN